MFRGGRVLPVRDVQRDVSARSRDHDGACAVRTSAHGALHRARLRLRRLLDERRAPARPDLLRATIMSAGGSEPQRCRPAVSARPHHVPGRLLSVRRRYATASVYSSHLWGKFSYPAKNSISPAQKKMADPI